MKWILGTAQFGLDYGISNVSGKTPRKDALEILTYAYLQGIRDFDTAAAYGDAERLLGGFFQGKTDCHVITKVSSDSLDQVAQSLSHFPMTPLPTLLLHSAQGLMGEGQHEIYKKLSLLKAKGMVKKIGVSVYSCEQASAISEKYPVDIIQFPMNVFDQRFLSDNFLNDLKSKGIELHVRSVFLQGLLLMEPAQLPPYFNPISNHVVHYWESLSVLGLSPLQAALGFVKSISEVDAIVFGVNNLFQLQEIMACDDVSVDAQTFRQFAINDDCFVNPTRWKNLCYCEE